MLYMGSREIAKVMGISVRQAQIILNMFEQQGKVIRNGTRKRVSVRVLSEYLSKQDGSDSKSVAKEIKFCLFPT